VVFRHGKSRLFCKYQYNKELEKSINIFRLTKV
jgi:hypothetical protein